MKTALIGHTGFVGSNLDAQFTFSEKFNSKNISEIENRAFDLVICSGVRAEKWLANKQPETDLAAIQSLLSSLSKVKCEEMIWISTVDVYPSPINVDEQTLLSSDGQEAYGRNRLIAELEIRKVFPRARIVRLSGLFGNGLKKNLIFDLLNPVPRFLVPWKMAQLISQASSSQRAILRRVYRADVNQNYELSIERGSPEYSTTHSVMLALGFTSLQFTHPDSQFQFYPLTRLWSDINLVKEYDLHLVNLVAQPATAREIAGHAFQLDLPGNSEARQVRYDIHTQHASVFGGDSNYIMNKDSVLKQIKDFFRGQNR